jgi:glycosyltransferase involved in cell wall biosynthesis
MGNKPVAKKIKLMFCIDYLYASTGGTENQLIKLINNMDQDKYELYLLSLRNTPWLEQNKSGLKCSVTALDYNQFNHKDPRNLISIWEIFRTMKRICPDIVITFFKISYILSVISARLAGVKYIISTRRDYGLWLDPRGIHLINFANLFVHSIITNSNKVKELTCKEEKIDPSRVHVIYNGLDLKEFSQSEGASESDKISYGIPVNHKVVGILAGLRSMKNHDCFLKAAKRVSQARPDVSFAIIGDGPLRASLEESTRELGIKERVFFLGWKKDISRILSIVDIGVNCSSNEGMSNAIMEYMASGVPCIVSDAGGNSELITHNINGYTFPVNDDNSLSRHIITLLDDAEKSREFAMQSRVKIESHMTVEKMIAEYDSYFDSIQ